MVYVIEFQKLGIVFSTALDLTAGANNARIRPQIVQVLIPQAARLVPFVAFLAIHASDVFKVVRRGFYGNELQDSLKQEICS